MDELDDCDEWEKPPDRWERLDELKHDLWLRSSYTSSGLTGRTTELDKALAARGGSKGSLPSAFESAVSARILGGGPRVGGNLPLMVLEA